MKQLWIFLSIALMQAYVHGKLGEFETIPIPTDAGVCNMANHENAIIFTTADRRLFRLDDRKLSEMTGVNRLIPLRGQLAVGHDGTSYLIEAKSYKVLALDRAGFLIWRSREATPPADETTIEVSPDGTIVFMTNSNQVVAKSPEGADLWETPILEDPGSSRVELAADGRIALGEWNGTMTCLGPNGRRLWSVHGLDSVEGRYRFSQDGCLIVGTESGQLISIDQHGKIRWSRVLSAPISQPPTLVGKDCFIVMKTDLEVECYNQNGESLWKFRNKYPRPPRAVSFGRSLYILCGDRDEDVLYELDVDGKLRKTISLEIMPLRSLRIINGYRYMGASRRGLLRVPVSQD
ncbi:MAG TPA: PQQ-binding-like beta-propeller repeat protein [Chthoniobacterales bacterium]